MDDRMDEHPVLNFHRGKEVTIYFNGQPIRAYEGETIAVALHAAGIRILSHSLKGRPRGFFCGIGKCSSCMMRVNGIPNVRACITPVEDGMIIESQDRLGQVPESHERKSKKVLKKVDVLIVGGGPAGMAAAITAAKGGASVLVVDDNPRIGGQLIKQTHKFFGSAKQNAGIRGIEIAERMMQQLGDLMENARVEVKTSTTAIGFFREIDDPKGTIRVVTHHNLTGEVDEILAKALIIATGARENMLSFEGNDLPGVYGAGGVQTLMNLYGVKPDQSVLMIGAGNVGLIVSYQLMQAGVEVKGVVEAMPRIGGYMVHAAKIRRMGVPIYTSHSIVRAKGKDRIEGAVIAQLDEKWNFIPGTEKEIECDVICLAVGLTPSVELLYQAGAEIRYVPELGGHVPLHNEYMETTVENIYVAGDVSGIEEASSAIMEGHIAGASALIKLGIGNREELEAIRRENLRELEEERNGPFGERIRRGLERVLDMYREVTA